MVRCQYSDFIIQPIFNILISIFWVYHPSSFQYIQPAASLKHQYMKDDQFQGYAYIDNNVGNDGDGSDDVGDDVVDDDDGDDGEDDVQHC